MPKIKVKCQNRSQQVNAINKARAWGATARDGDYGPVTGKLSIVVNTKLGGGASIQLSRTDYSPSSNPYNQVISYKDFMNATTCPWDSSATIRDLGPTDGMTQADPKIVKVHHTTVLEVDTGVCAQETLVPKACDVLTQETIAWKTLGLPFLQDAGVQVTMDDGVPYILYTKKNAAKKLTAGKAAKWAKRDLLAGEDSVWVLYAKEFNLFDNVVLGKDLGDDQDSDN